MADYEDIMPDEVFSFEKMMESYYLAIFADAYGVPYGQKWAEFEKDGEQFGAVLWSSTGTIYTFPIKCLGLGPFGGNWY